ncbi:hypothetical protein ACTWP5_30035 [Streptomyces sp. 4N509B]|uniref:hypothetical protein n=1 Tax=Streptomyces sp. 4N509B TaxID=3457413 RepID=UPI003FD13447
MPGPYNAPQAASTAQWQAQTGQPPTPTPPGGGRQGRGKIAVAIVAATAVVAAAAITAAFLMTGDDEDNAEAGGGGESVEPTGEETGDNGGGGDAEGGDSGGSDPDNPRREVLERPDPVVAPDWQVQTIENRHNAFDVPPEDQGWVPGTESYAVGFLDDREDSDTYGDYLVAMSGVSTYMDGWCPDAEYGVSWRAVAGTKGGQGATGTEEAAENEARNWALAAYDQNQEGRLSVSDPEPFESEHGISGHTVTATITNVPEDPDNPCGTFDGKVVTVSYLDLNNDLATWVLAMDTGFPEEIDDATIEQMMNSLRPYPAEDAN